jgi:hypothetical protein
MLMVMMTMMIIIQFFIYLRAELNSQWPLTELARIQTKSIRQDKNKRNNETKKNGSAKAYDDDDDDNNNNKNNAWISLFIFYNWCINLVKCHTQWPLSCHMALFLDYVTSAFLCGLLGTRALTQRTLADKETLAVTLLLFGRLEHKLVRISPSLCYHHQTGISLSCLLFAIARMLPCFDVISLKRKWDD